MTKVSRTGHGRRARSSRQGPGHAARRKRLPLRVLAIGSLVACSALWQPPSASADPDIHISASMSLDPSWDQPSLTQFDDLALSDGNTTVHTNWVESPGAAQGQSFAKGIKITEVPAGWVPLPKNVIVAANQDGSAEGTDYLGDEAKHVNEAFCVSKGEELAPQAPPSAAAPQLPRSQGPARAPSATDAALTNGTDSGTDPVNPFNGELVISETDLEFPGFGVPYRHTRTYRSRVVLSGGPFGDGGWDHGLNRQITTEPGGPCAGVAYTTGDGTTMRFVQAATLTTQLSANVTQFETLYTSPKGVRITLRAQGTDTLVLGNDHAFHVIDAEWTMTTPDGITATFDKRGVMTRIEDLNQRGLSLTWIETSAADGYRVTKVTDSVGREIAYEYDTLDRLIRVVHVKSGLEASYTYEGGDLASATSSNGRTESYVYDSGHPDEIPDYIPEGQLRGSCERLCGAAGSSCEATGICDNFAAEAKPLCEASCVTCVEECADSCTDYCYGGEGYEACRTQDGPGGEPSCRTGCQAECGARANDICDAFWYGKKLNSTDDAPGPSVESLCANCNDECVDTCGITCDVLSECLALAATTTTEGGPGGGAAAASAGECVERSGLEGAFATLNDWLGTVVFGLGDLISCGTSYICDLFGADCGDCEFDNVQDAFMSACNNSCYKCCSQGDNCAPTSCQKGRTCEGDCRRAFYGIELPAVDNGFGFPIECANGTGNIFGTGGCPEEASVRCSQSCQAQCTQPCSSGCQVACNEGCATSCKLDVNGTTNTSCWQDCQALDYAGLCRTGCEDGCVEEGRKGGPPRYGYPRDLNHNLTAILDSDGVAYLTNTYGPDPTRPDFDAVTTQITGGRTVTLAYRDLEGEARSENNEVPAPIAGSPLATYTKSQGRFEPVDICPTPCDVPVVFPTGEWVPVPHGLLLVDQAASLGGLGVVGGVTSTAAIPPTLLAITESAGTYRATSATGTAGLPANLAFSLTLPSGHAIAFAPRSGGAWALGGNASALASFAGAHKEITLVRDTGAIVRVYPGRPRALAHVVEGSCGTPFRAERNELGQLQTNPEKACKGDLTLSPLATAVTDADLRGKFASGAPAALAAADTFGGSALVPGRYVVRWVRVPGFSGRYESALGPQEGSAPSTLTTAAFAAVQAAPLLRAPSPPSTLADGRPLFAFHLPESLRPTGTTSTAPTYVPAWDLGDKFDVPTRDGCFKTGMPGPAERGPASAGPVPTTASVVTDPYGIVWTFYYDARGNTLRQVNHGTGATRSYNYDSVGDLIGIEQPLGDRICLRYDDGGNLVNAFQFPVPGAIGDTFPIRQRWSYTTKPVRPEKVFDPRDPTKALATYEWDDRGRLLSITDATNTVTSFVPTELGLPGEIHGPDGSIETIDYDESVGLPRVITSDAMEASKVVRTMEYDDAGRPIEAVGELGEQLRWTWENGSLSATSQSADGVSTSTLYTIVDGQVRVSGHGLRMTDIAYDSLGLPRRMRVRAIDGSADTRVSCMSYGPGSRLLEEIRPDGSRMKYGYDGEGRLTSVVAGAWPRTTDDGFDPECVVTTSGPGQFSSGAVSTTTYDLNGRPILVKDAAGDTSTLAYDGFGRVAIVTDPRGTSHRAGYDAMGQAVWTASYAPSAAQTGYHAPVYGESGLLAAATTTYDELGRVQRQEVWQFDATTGLAIGTGKAITTYAYQPTLGQLLVTDPSGAQTLQTFDGAGRLVLTQFPTTDVEIITYLDGGRTVLREWSAPTADGVLTERTKLTAWGAPLQVETNETGALQVMGVWTYDADRRPIGTTGTSGQTQGVGYDAFGQPVAVETIVAGQSTEVTTLDYDRMGRVLLHTSDAGNGRGAVASSFSYDVLGRLRTATFPGGRSESFTYKLASSLVDQRTDPRGVKFNYLYTAGQLDAILATPPNDPTGAGKQLLTYTRDALGRPVSAKHSGAALLSPADDVTTALAYDSTGNKLKEWDSGLGAGLAITHVPDVRGLPKNSVLGSLVVDRTFDPLGRLTGVKLAGESANAVGFQYDGLGGPTQRQLASGVTTTYGYDALGRLESQTDTKGSTQLAAWRWEQGLDGVPRVAGLRKNGLPEIASVYQVDSAARVVAERAGVTGLAGTTLAPGDDLTTSNLMVAGPTSSGQAVKYTYDGRDNWKQRSSIATPALNVTPSVDAKDAYTTFGGLTPTYDARGALLTLGDETYTYDALGNLTSARKGAAQRHYEYDAFGRRIVERDGVTGAVTRFGYDGLSRVLRKMPDGAVDVTVDGGLDEHLVRVSGTTRHYYHQDRGRNVYLVTSSSGQPLEWYDYTAFGELGIRAPDGTARTSSAIGNRYGYQGQPFDHVLGLVDMRARAYRPAWGRFVSPDPIGYAGGSNLYAFVGSAPLSFWDPLGLARLAQATRDAVTTLSSIANNMRVGDMFRRELAATLSLENVLVDAVRNAPGNAWSWAKAVPGGAAAGAKGLWHSVTSPRETIAAMLRADAAILGWISDPSMPDLDVVGAAVTNYALHHDEREVAGDIGGATGGALFAIGSGGVAAAGVARVSALLRGLGAGTAEAVAGTAAATEATTAAAESVALRTLSNAELRCVWGGCARPPSGGGLYARPGFRKAALEDAKAAAPVDDAGQIICETCDEMIPETISIETRNGPVLRRGGDLDHYPETWAERVAAFKARSKEPLRSEVIDAFNRNLRYICPICNQGHKWEGVPGPFRKKK